MSESNPYPPMAEEDKINPSPIEQVRLIVPTTDDPSLTVLTFRTWLLGLTSCIILSFINQFFLYRQTSLSVSSTIPQILALPLGNLMARTLPTKPIRIPATKWRFSLNPGPFNVKEHVLISTIAFMGNAPYAVNIIIQTKAFYHQELNPLAALLLIVTTQLLGYGFAGMFMKLLVESPYMWWPSILADVSFFRALHEVEVRPKGQLTRLQFLLFASVLSFAYYIIPNYFFPSITALSFVCWIWKDSVTAQQLGSGRNGLGLGSFTLDWGSITSFLGNPLFMPMFTIVNKLVGVILIFYIITPIAYWTNLYNAKQFPIFSSGLFDVNGNIYNISRILDEKEFKFNQEEYYNYSKIHLSTFFALNYGFRFASLTASLTHVALFYGRSVWIQIKEAYGKQKVTNDIHNQLMKKYDPIPQWWYYAILISMMGLAIVTCEVFGGQIQLPFWGVLLASALVMIFIVPIGVLTAISNTAPPVNNITEMIIGYLYPGKPIANIAFKSYGMVSLSQATVFLASFKEGLYMKIPPRSMFLAQVIGTLVSATVNFGTAWWLVSSVENICNPAKLPEGSPWTCPGEDVVNSFSNIWGLVGPSRIFAPFGQYKNIYIFFLIGALSPISVWMLSRAFPEKKWIRLINFPIILGATSTMPPIRAVQLWPWFALGFFFSYVVYRKYNEWWTRYNYLLGSGLDIGVTLMALLVSIALPGVYGVNWWGMELDDHCPLAHCPTAPGISIDGCPVFH